MTMKSLSANRVLLTCCVAGGLIACAPWILNWVETRANANDSRPPYAAIVRLNGKVTDRAGAVKVLSHWTQGVRSDGATVLLYSSSSGGRRELQRLVQLPNGDQIHISDLLEIKSTLHSPPEDLQRKFRDPASLCMNNLAGGKAGGRQSGERISGQEHLGGVRTVTIEDPLKSSRTWYALDFGCAEVRSRIDFGSSISEKDLISITAGEVEPQLFHSPASFREVPPSEFAMQVNPDVRKNCPSCLETFRRDDERYDRARSLRASRNAAAGARQP